MSILMIRAKLKPTQASEVEAGIKSLFGALEQTQPEGIRYASCQLADEVTYLVFLEINEGVDNPLATLPEFHAFQEALKTSLAEPPTTEQLTVRGSYRFF